MKKIKLFENFDRVNETKEMYTVVSQEAGSGKWGIESDFEAEDEDDAIKQGNALAIKNDANRRSVFYAFPAGSQELEDFINDHNFVD